MDIYFLCDILGNILQMGFLFESHPRNDLRVGVIHCFLKQNTQK
jgi:hypothetical protein